jgi:hypothetical protein
MNFSLKVDLKHLEIIENAQKDQKKKRHKKLLRKNFRVKNGNFFNRKLFQKMI